MADVDRSPHPYRAAVEVLWWLECLTTGAITRRQGVVEARGADPDGDRAALIVGAVNGALYRARKDAESVALARLYVREGQRQLALNQLAGLARVHVQRWQQADERRVKARYRREGRIS